MVEFGDLNSHLLADSHTCSSDYYKTLLVQFETLFPEKMNPRNDMRKHPSNQENPHCTAYHLYETFKNI